MSRAGIEFGFAALDRQKSREVPMNKLIAGALAAAAVGAFAVSAQAEQVCQWTGSDWACGNGNVFTEHYSETAGPNMIITSAPAPFLPNGQPVPVQYAAPRE
jgi:hypothetical protein